MHSSKIVSLLSRGIRTGSLDITLPGGERHTISGDDPGPEATVVVHRWRTLRRLAFGGRIGLAEAYMDGDWDSPDLVPVIELAVRNRGLADSGIRPSTAARLLHWLRHSLRANTLSGSRKNIAYHYDLGNAFYERWLDSTMTYSSAIYAMPDQSLDEAQRNKCRQLLDRMGATNDDHVLEIGCGWGGFAILAAKERGVKITGIPLSQEQHDLAAARVQSEGLAERVRIEMRDYRDISETYDHVASIEMLEAVGERYWPVFFSKVFDSLKSGGRAALQVITIDDRHFESYRRSADFIQTYVFPGGMLPSPSALQREVAEAGLKWHSDSGFGQDYAKTLRNWRERFEEKWAEIEPLGFDERFRRMWRFYLAYCEGGFRAASIDVKQLALVKA